MTLFNYDAFPRFIVGRWWFEWEGIWVCHSCQQGLGPCQRIPSMWNMVVESWLGCWRDDHRDISNLTKQVQSPPLAVDLGGRLGGGFIKEVEGEATKLVGLVTDNKIARSLDIRKRPVQVNWFFELMGVSYGLHGISVKAGAAQLLESSGRRER